MQRSVSYLKTRFENDDIPQQADYEDVFDSFVNLEASANQTMSGPLTVTTLNATVVSAQNLAISSAEVSALTMSDKIIHSFVSANGTGEVQAGATLLDKDVTYAVVTSADRAFVLTPIELGRVQHITNTGTTAATIYPASGANFVGTAEDAGILLAADTSMIVTHIQTSAYSFLR